jgi:hypothetical protein
MRSGGWFGHPRWVAGGALALLLGCGGKVSEAEQSAPTGALCSEGGACGGDPTGTWDADELCVDFEFVSSILDCDDWELSSTAFRVRGVARFDEDWTYRANLSYDGASQISVSDACVSEATGGSGCDAYAAVLLARGELFLETAECEEAGAACACTLALIPIDWPLSGDWDGDTARLSGGGEGEYCVEGDRLRLTLGGGSEPSALLVFRKR